MSDRIFPARYWASVEANPDKPKIAFIPVTTLDDWNAQLRRRLRRHDGSLARFVNTKGHNDAI